MRIDPRRLDFVPLRDAAHVAPYHEIRRMEIFARYRPGLVYDTAHPDDAAAQNLGHVLLLDREVVGTFRIDLIDRDRAGFRLIAVKGDYKNRGLGGVMMERAEALTRAYGRRSIVINAARPAARFYRARGYTEGDWPDVLPFDPLEQVRVGKRLT
jgi:GNAT superfamily N-acetyltransferase